MAIKKPLIKSKLASAPAPAPSKFKKRLPAPVEQEEEPEPEEEPEEEPETPAERKLRLQAAAKKSTIKRRPAPVEEEEPEPEADPEVDSDNEADVQEGEPEEEEPAPRRKGSAIKKKAGKKRSLADVFDETKPGRGLFPVGDFMALVKSYELEGEIADDPNEQGLLKVKVQYEGHENEEEVAGKTISQWYQIADEDGEPGPGIPFLKGDLDILGYEDVLLADLEEIFDDVAAEQPVVIIKVKQNGQYTNAYLQGLAETE